MSKLLIYSRCESITLSGAIAPSLIVSKQQYSNHYSLPGDRRQRRVGIRQRRLAALPPRRCGLLPEHCPPWRSGPLRPGPLRPTGPRRPRCPRAPGPRRAPCPRARTRIRERPNFHVLLESSRVRHNTHPRLSSATNKCHGHALSGAINS